MTTTTPYRMSTVERVEPGDVVEHDLVPFHVDELRRNVDGWSLLGWPGMPREQRRQVVNLKPGAEVRVLAAGDTAAEIAGSILDAVRVYALEWTARSAETLGEAAPPSAPLDADATGIIVRTGGHEWRVELPW